MSREKRLRWGVAGVGIAGRARAKAIVSDPRADLSGVWRDRFPAETGAPVLETYEALLACVDGVAICSPTAFHAEQVRLALQAGKHVVVEFPMAETAEQACALLDLAKEAKKLLHVAHIELLDAPCGTLTAHIRVETIRSIVVAFDRAGPQETTSHELALGNVARLHRVMAVGGPIASVDRVTYADGVLSALLTLCSGPTVRATFRQAPYLVRRTLLEVDTVAGRWTQEDDALLRDSMPITLVGLGGLFVRDQRAATARALDAAEPYVTDGRVLHVLDVVGMLAGLRTGPVITRDVPHRSDAG